MSSKFNNGFIIFYGGCGKIGIGSIDLFIKKGIFVLNIDPNYKDYHQSKISLYKGFDNSNFEKSLPELRALILELSNKYNFLGIVNFSRIPIQNNKKELSQTKEIDEIVFKIMLFDFIRILDELLILKLSNFSIVHFSSLNATQVSHQSILYHSIKGAIESTNRSLAYKLADKNIRSNVIIPGLVNTSINNPDNRTKQNEKVIPLRRGAPNSTDIANLVFFLISNESKCITGSSVLIDSGMSLPDSFTTINKFFDKKSI